MRNKVKYKVVLEKHAIFEANTQEEIARLVQRQADTVYYQNSDDVKTEIISIEPMD